MLIKPSQYATVKRLYQAGDTVQEIARLYGCSVTTVRNVIKETGYSKRVPMPDEDEIYDLYIERDYTRVELAGHYKVKPTTIDSWIHRANLSKRVD